MKIRYWAALIVFSAVVFLLAYPFVSDVLGRELKPGALGRKPDAWHRIRPEFHILHPEFGPRKVNYWDYVDFSHLNTDKVMSEEEVSRLAPKGVEGCKTVLLATTKGAELAKDLVGFTLAPRPLPFGCLAAGVFFAGGAIVLILMALIRPVKRKS